MSEGTTFVASLKRKADEITQEGSGHLETHKRPAQETLPKPIPLVRKRPIKPNPEYANVPNFTEATPAKSTSVITPLLPVDQSSIGPYAVPPGKQIQLQDGRCLKPEYKKAKQCGACVKREAGKACLFSGFRAFLLNPGAGWFATEDTPYFFASSSLPSQSFSFNSTFNRPITDQDKDDIRRTAAQALLPAMEQELAHARRSNAVRRPLDYTSRNVCDFCLANFFIGSFFCGGCGKEFCSECMEVIQGYLPGKGKPVHPSRPEDAGSDAYDPIYQYHRPEENEVVYSNTGRIKREPGSASPAPGGPRAMSAAALADIAALPPSVQVKNGKIVAHNIKRLLTCSHNRLHGMDDMVAVTSSTEQELERLVKGMSMYDTSSPPPKRDPYTLPAGLPAKYPTDSLPYLIIDEADLTPEVFDKVWSQGQTVVISGLEDRFKIDWSPQSFAEAFARMKCSVEDAQLGKLESLRLGDFFANFGNDYQKRGATWKLKDWPSANDFAEWQPDLFEDYENALPLPDMTRRDGVANLAAHFPVNVNRPDLGPKYGHLLLRLGACSDDSQPDSTAHIRAQICLVARARQDVSIDQRDFRCTLSQLSPLVHVDVADAINILVSSSKDTSLHLSAVPEEGALWYIYPATDAAKIREYCYEHIAKRDSKPNRPLTVEAVKEVYQDPIHTQQIYLNSSMREELFRKYGVKGWKIIQNVGQAVLVPAGSPHQVCNLSDCIKVASDFASLENIDRCWQTSSEFRLLTQGTKSWREDLLQLKNMIYYSWLANQPEDLPEESEPYETPASSVMDEHKVNTPDPNPAPVLRGISPLQIQPVLKPGSSRAPAPLVHPINTPSPGPIWYADMDIPRMTRHAFRYSQVPFTTAEPGLKKG